MQFHERLMDLLGHEVSVAVQADGAAREVAAGSLKEVGPDYLILSTGRTEKGGAGRGGVDWWIRSSLVVAVVHDTACPKCSAPG